MTLKVTQIRWRGDLILIAVTQVCVPNSTTYFLFFFSFIKYSTFICKH